MRINHNAAATNTYSRLSSAQGAQAKSLEKLSSGLRINRAGDDAAGLAISEKMRGQISGLNQASRNAQDGISLIQTAEGGLNETQSILQRMRELAVQSSNDTNTDSDRVEIQKEVNQLTEEISRISNDTQFNEQELLNGSFNGKFHIGANKGQNMALKIDGMSATDLSVGVDFKASTSGTDRLLTAGTDSYQHFAADAVVIVADSAAVPPVEEVKAEGAGYYDTTTGKLFHSADAPLADDAVVLKGINVSDQISADASIETIGKAIATVSAERSKLGSVQNRLDHTINNLTATSENLSAAESRIRDVDMAKEMMEFTKNNILNQASTAMLAQANQMPQGVLQLLG